MPLPKESNTKLWLALLHEIEAAGGQVEPSVIYPKIHQYFPEITNSDLDRMTASGENQWTNRLQWVRQDLVYVGCIDAATRGVWTITPLGRTWLKQHWRGAGADYSQVSKPPKLVTPVKVPKSPAKLPTPPAPMVAPPPTQTIPPPGILEVVDPVEALCRRLIKAQRLSDNHTEFENALRDAFAFLGFDAKHIGGSSETDVLLITYLNTDSYRAIVDAKSTKSGKVSDAQINWPALEGHRKQNAADYAVVIGEEFSGGNLKKFAEQYKVTLLLTETVCEVVRLHARTPFGLLDLRELFAEVSLSTHGLDSLRRRHESTRRHWRLLLEIVEQIEAYNRHAPAGLMPKAETLYHILLGPYITGARPMADAPTTPDIQDALTFLASAAIGIVRRVPGSDDAYQLIMTAETAKRRLSAVAGVVAGLHQGAAASLPVSGQQAQAKT